MPQRGCLYHTSETASVHTDCMQSKRERFSSASHRVRFFSLVSSLASSAALFCRSVHSLRSFFSHRSSSCSFHLHLACTLHPILASASACHRRHRHLVIVSRSFLFVSRLHSVIVSNRPVPSRLLFVVAAYHSTLSSCARCPPSIIIIARSGSREPPSRQSRI